MRRLIILFMLLSGFAYGQSTGVYSIVTTPSYGLLYTNKVAVPRIMAENYLSGNVQTFAAAAGYETVTNFTTSYSYGITATQTNLTPLVTGWYLVLMPNSFNSDQNSMFAHCHFFSNDIEVARIGWSRGFGTAASGQDGSAAGISLIEVASNVNCEARIDVDKNSTLTFDHQSFMMIFMSK